MHRLSCPSCDAVLQFPVDPTGRNVRCKNCGNRFVAPSDEDTDAPEPPPPAPAEKPRRPRGEFQGKAKAGLQDAWTVMRRLAVNPVGGIGEAHAALGEQRAFIVGIVFGIFVDLCVMFLFTGGGVPGMNRRRSSDLSVEMVLKSLLMGAVPLVSFALATLILRKICRVGGSWKSDVFVAGASLLPLGVDALIVRLAGPLNVILILPVQVFAACLLVLVLYRGLTQVAKIPEVPATWGVPATIVIAGVIMVMLSVSIVTA